MGAVFAGLFNLAMRIVHERFKDAGHYERTLERRGYANGTKAKKLDTPAGTATLQCPRPPVTSGPSIYKPCSAGGRAPFLFPAIAQEPS